MSSDRSPAAARLAAIAKLAGAKRPKAMPEVVRTLVIINSAITSLRELGWSKAGAFKIKEGDPCAVIEFGSTGIFSGVHEGEYVCFCDTASSPDKLWLKPVSELSEYEAKHMAKCDALEVKARERELEAYARMAEPTQETP